MVIYLADVRSPTHSFMLRTGYTQCETRYLCVV